jgi:hypothetical protein
MRRILLVLTAFLIMAAMLMASALPALAQGPPTIPPGAQFAIPNVVEHHNPFIGVSLAPVCLTLNAPPGRTDIGHHSDFPDFCSTR